MVKYADELIAGCIPTKKYDRSYARDEGGSQKALESDNESNYPTSILKGLAGVERRGKSNQLCRQQQDEECPTRHKPRQAQVGERYRSRNCGATGGGAQGNLPQPPLREARGYRRRRRRRSINSKTAPASNAKPLVPVAGSISGTDDTVGTAEDDTVGTAEAVPAKPITIIARLLPNKISRVVVIAFILFTPVKQSQLICVKGRTGRGNSPKHLSIRFLRSRYQTREGKTRPAGISGAYTPNGQV